MDQSKIICIITVKHRRLNLHKEKKKQNQHDHLKRKKCLQWITNKYYWRVPSSSSGPWNLLGNLRTEEIENLSSDIVKFIHTLMLSDHLLRYSPRLCPSSTVPCMLVLKNLLYRVTRPKNGILRCLILARKSRPTKPFVFDPYRFICFVPPDDMDQFRSFVLERLDRSISLNQGRPSVTTVEKKNIQKR